MADITLRKVSGQCVDTVPNGTIITIAAITNIVLAAAITKDLRRCFCS